jgi:hypothetical protein
MGGENDERMGTIHKFGWVSNCGKLRNVLSLQQDNLGDHFHLKPNEPDFAGYMPQTRKEQGQ